MKYVGIALSLSLASGCIFGGSSNSNSSQDTDTNGSADASTGGSASGTTTAWSTTAATTGGGPTLDLSPCADGFSQAEIDDTITITSDFVFSAHEMIVCGGLAFTICAALLEGLIEFATDPGGSALPDSYTYDGAGTYHAEVDGFSNVSMDVQFFAGKDYGFASQGELVEPNLFVMSSYLVGASVSTDVFSGTVEIDFSGHGPLVELLGFGATPSSPIEISLNNVGRLDNEVATLEMQTVVTLHDESGSSIIDYHVTSPRAIVESVLNGSRLGLDLVDASGSRAALSQSLTTTVWDIEYVDGQLGRLDGTIDFTVDGENFPFQASLIYPQTNLPEVTISCQ